MKFQGIDYDKCIGCGRCVNDCVTNYLAIVRDETSEYFGKPTPVPKSRCIGCCHCYAICPAGAVLFQPPLADYEEETDNLLSIMTMKRTVRTYTSDETIDKKDIERLITAGQSAPTEKNRNTVRILFIKNKLDEVYGKAVDWLVDYVGKTGTINPMYAAVMYMDTHREEVLWGAEYLVTIIGRTDAVVDAAIAAERMQLEAVNLGLGSGYRGDMKMALNSMNDTKELLDLKGGETVLAAFALGKTHVHYVRSVFKSGKRVDFI